MLKHPNLDPVALHLGPLKIHWYGLMYLVGFWGGWWLAVRRGRRPDVGFPQQAVSDLLFYCVLGVILGGRIGYTLFYNLHGFLAEPLSIFRIWEGGMSFHGGFLGVMAAIALYAHHSRRPFFEVTDFVCVVVPVGLFTGRIGNFINSELWGAPSSLPWAMVFPNDPDQLPRHPSMLYEAGLEGLLLFALLWWFGSRPRPRMAISGLFMLGYGLARVAVEFIRIPDPQIGYLAWGWVTMGQLLSLPMILFGLLLLGLAYGRPRSRSPRVGT